MILAEARRRANVAFYNKTPVLTREGLRVYTTKIAKQLLKLQNQVVHKAFGFVANYLNWVGQLPQGSRSQYIYAAFYGHDYMYDIFTVLRLARRCGYGEPSEGSQGASTKAVIVIGGELRDYLTDPRVFHFFEGVIKLGKKVMRGHSTNAFKGLYAIGAIKGVGRGGTSDLHRTDCVELSGEI